MRTVIFLAAMTAFTVKAQTIYSPLKASDVPKDSAYTDKVWYTDEHQGVFTFVAGDDRTEGQKFLESLAKDLNIDLRAPYDQNGKRKYYKSEVCEYMEIDWTKLTYGRQMIYIRVII